MGRRRGDDPSAAQVAAGIMIDAMTKALERVRQVADGTFSQAEFEALHEQARGAVVGVAAGWLSPSEAFGVLLRIVRIVRELAGHGQLTPAPHAADCRCGLCLCGDA